MAWQPDFHVPSVPRGMLTSETDAHGRITQVNDAFCTLSGYTRQELIGQTHAIVNSGSHPKSFFTAMFATLIRDGVWRGVICNRSKCGSLYWIDSTIRVYRDSHRRITNFGSVSVDVTGTRRAASHGATKNPTKAA